MGTASVYGTSVTGSRLCNWGLPTNRNFYTTAQASGGEVYSNWVGVHSGSSGCGYV